ncbi:hypothetical protein Btru_013338 [Bulinus truncatus]|nr:hypothetical protein Btru_013338 [Bulinus truncatus]
MSTSPKADKISLAKRSCTAEIDDAVPTKIPKLEISEAPEGQICSSENTPSLTGVSKSSDNTPSLTAVSKKRAASDISKSAVIPLKQIKLENNSLSDLRQSKKHVRKRTKSLFQSIVMQMEFYFSDANLLKDRYLKSLIDQSPDGYVNLLEFGKFNKLQSLHKDGVSLSILIKALRTSKFLQLNEDESKVKRITPLVEVSQDEVDSRTVYVEDLPPQANHLWVRNIFSKCGKVVYISLPVYKTTKQIKEFAFVEFETAEEATKACQLLNNPLPSKAVERPGKFPKGNKDLNRLHKALPSEHKNTGKKQSSDDTQPAAKIAEIKIKEESGEKVPESGDQVSSSKKKKKSKKKKATDDSVKATSDSQTEQGQATSDNQTEHGQSTKKKKKKKKKKKNAEDSISEEPKSTAEEPTSTAKESKSTTEKPKSTSKACVEEGINVKVEMENEIQNLSGQLSTRPDGEKALCEEKDKVIKQENVKFQEERERVAKRKKKDLTKLKLVDADEQKRAKKQKKLDKEKTECVETVPALAISPENQKLSRKERKRLRQEDIRKKKTSRSEILTLTSETVDVKPDCVTENGENSCVKEETSTSEVTVDAVAEEAPAKVEKSEITSILKLKKGQEKKKVEFDPVAVTTEFLKGREIRKRKKPKKNQLHLRVISKRDWLSLKAEYIAQQKSHVAALKESLRELRQQENQDSSGNRHVDLEDVFGTKRLKTSHEVKMAHVESLKFIPNVIVQWKCSYDVHRDKIKTMFKEISGNSIAYIDAMEEAKTGYIRFKDEASAEEFAKMSRNSNSFMARVLPLDQQQAYWAKANEDRVKKLAGKKKEKGADKIARKVFERNKATFNHKPTRIVFNEDETGESSAAVKKDNPGESTTTEG